MRTRILLAALGLIWSSAAETVRAQDRGSPAAAIEESAYYVLETVPIPGDVALEVGGLALLPSGDIAVATRRGEVWMVENPDGWGDSPPFFRRFAHGLHEPLGLAYRDGVLFAAQRGELTRLEDTDGDGRADVYDVVYDWPVTGNYHEYSFGPVFRHDGSMVVTLNLGTVGQMASLEKWRGWMLEIDPEGEMRPLAAGMRSPAGLAVLSDGAIFYAENQGDWIGSGWLTHVEAGDFVGHPAGLRWAGLPGSLLTLKPEDIPDTGRPMFEVAEQIPALKPPAVWFPHGILGVSASGILEDTTGGAFGPFAGQVFVGDQGHSKIMRVALEMVDGVYQGAAFPFREGFQSGVLRMIWDRAGAMYVGMTSRGWDATGGSDYGLQRLRWSGMVPFEARTVEARPDGFEIEYTLPLDVGATSEPAAYQVTSFTYRYHSTYGSPVIDQTTHRVLEARVDDDRQRVRLAVDSLRQGYIYEIKFHGARSEDGHAPLHDTAYYTLNRIPQGERLVVEADSRRAAAMRAEVAEAATALHEDDSSNAHAHQRPDADEAQRQDADASQRPDADASQRPKRLTEMPSDWGQPDATFTIGTVPGLRFDLPAFEVESGARIELVFQNDDDMLHNLVGVMPGTADEVAADAIALGLQGPELHYVPRSDEVLFHTSLLQPGGSESIYFIAPTTPGEYTYVCTFPGHAVSMRGTMHIRR